MAKSHSQKQYFSHRHIPKYSVLLVKSLGTPLLIYFALAGNFFMFSCAYLFYYFETPLNPNVTGYADALWWAICTVSTVGYGDIYPMTGKGRLVGALLIIIGISFFLSFMAVLVSVMTELISESEKTSKSPLEQ
ncbi:MAG: hypothetical protein A4S09_11615 [Proteobacteria bacterium SG_bin7]|nr:MAG: hypothetical protein A4S09_11615 [Proteobacteria bacterium SG_bin7]